jgi:GDP-4-dehydro-6-deoxy-D-mannose reductase
MVASDPQLSDYSILPVSPDLDLVDNRAADELVKMTEPDAVIHLAAQSSVAESFRSPEATLTVNLFGTLHLLQALKTARFRGRVLYVGTGDVYGVVDESALPVVETHLPTPRNPYAVSKLAAETLCRQWVYTDDMQVVLARPFNHIGPGQSTSFAVPGFARQIVNIRSCHADSVVSVGDIDVTRDFTDVRDVIRAYFALLDQGVPGEVYNVCSGVETSVRLLLERLIAIAGVTARVEVDRSRLRKAEQRRMRGSADKIRETTGWMPTVSLEESLLRILRHFEEGTSSG